MISKDEFPDERQTFDALNLLQKFDITQKCNREIYKTLINPFLRMQHTTWLIGYTCHNVIDTINWLTLARSMGPAIAAITQHNWSF